MSMEAVKNLQQANTTHKVVGIQGAGWVIIGCFLIAIAIYYFLLGNPANFVNKVIHTVSETKDILIACLIVNDLNIKDI